MQTNVRFFAWVLPVMVTVVAGSGCAVVDKTVAPILSSGDEQTLSGETGNENINSPVAETEDARSPSDARGESGSDSAPLPVTPSSDAPPAVTPATTLRTFRMPTRAGTLQDSALTEVSGMISSALTPGVLYAVNDSGNSATLYAMRDNGEPLANWQIDARNRDWEDMARTQLNGTHYLVIGDTGDNLQVHTRSVLHFIEEPTINVPTQGTLTPAFSIGFTYEDGPRNVEAFAITDNIVYLISKEPVTAKGAQPSRLYTLSLEAIASTSPALSDNLVARFAGELPVTPPNLEARLAASLAGVDLNHPTALDFDGSGRHAYVLTYRHVIRFSRTDEQSWPAVFNATGTRVHAHSLEQAEALAVDTGRAVFFTSEHASAPVWALPINPPL